MIGVALTPQEWFEKLQELFRVETREKWDDGKERPRDPAPRNKHLDTLWSYYCGDPPLPQVSAEYQDVFRDIMRKSRSNPSEMCVSAVVARMELHGVATKTDNSANGDDLANTIMEDSGFAAQFKDIEVFKSAMGESYALVVKHDPQSGMKPTIHAIDPRRCVGVEDPLIPSRLKAVMIKEFDVERGREIAHMFLPGVDGGDGRKWLIDTDESTGKYKDVPDEPTQTIAGINEFGGVPVVKFSNPLGMGEYEAHIDVLDRLIDITLQSMILMRFQAMRPTAVMGDDPEDEDEYDTEDTDPDDMWQPQAHPDAVDRPNANQKSMGDVLKAGPGEVWKLPDGWKVWQGAPGDVQGILGAKRDASKEFATHTHTPLYLIAPDDASGSATGAEVLREALTSKVRDRRSRDTVSLKLLWRITFAMAGEKTRGEQIKLRWGPIEFKSLTEKAAATQGSKGVLSRRRMQREIWDMPDEDIVENEAELEEEALLAQARAAALAALTQAQQPNQGDAADASAQPEPVTDDSADDAAA